MSKDPIRFNGGVNLYAYVGNDPINLVDPNGQVAQAAAVGGAAFPLLPAIGVGVGLYCLFNSGECANFFKKLKDDVVDACRPKDFAPPNTPRPDPDCAGYAQRTYDYCMNVLKQSESACAGAANVAYAECVAGRTPGGG